MNMKNIFLFICGLLACLPLHIHAANNLPLGAPFPDVAYVRQDCASLQNCADNMTEMLAWTWSTRDPSETAPLLIDIGPGSFAMPFDTCSVSSPNQNSDRGHTTLRGSGRNNTVLTASAASGTALLQINGCNNIIVQDLAIDSTESVGNTHFGIVWTGGGSSSWTNVAVFASSYAWYTPNACTLATRGRHEWFSSILHTQFGLGFSIAYNSNCEDSWIWGSELIAETEGGSTQQHIGVKSSAASSSVHIYGTDVRVIAKAGSSSPGGQIGLYAQSGGQIHHHGGEIVVRHEASNNQDVYGIVASLVNSRVHVLETSFGILPGLGGTAIRSAQFGGGSAQSAFQWVPSTDAPMPGNGTEHIKSVDGQDSFVETDCPMNAGCQTSGDFPHLMIYTEACAGRPSIDQGPWFDTVTHNCRGL